MEEANAIQLYTVNEYVFEKKEDYDAAMQEKKGIKYLSAQLDLNNAQKVCELYNELIEKHVFSTAVGMDYLKKLREAVAKKEPDLLQTMRKIPISSSNHKNKNEMDKYVSTRVEGQLKAMEKRVEKTKDRFRNSFIVNIVLILLVGAMVILTFTSSNPTILDYKTKIENQYASWSEELKKTEEEQRKLKKELERREQAVLEKEKELGIDTETETK